MQNEYASVKMKVWKPEGKKKSADKNAWFLSYFSTMSLLKKLISLT